MFYIKEAVTLNQTGTELQIIVTAFHLLCLFTFQLITAKLTQVSANMPSSPDSSSDSSTGSLGNHGNHYSDGPNPEVESCLPGVVRTMNFF